MRQGSFPPKKRAMRGWCKQYAEHPGRQKKIFVYFVSDFSLTIFRTDFSSRADDVPANKRRGAAAAGEDRSSPPARPPGHAPWIYPSDIQIDPSSLEVSPKPGGGEEEGEDEDEGFSFARQLIRQRQQQQQQQQRQQQQQSREAKEGSAPPPNTEEFRSEVDELDEESELVRAFCKRKKKYCIILCGKLLRLVTFLFINICWWLLNYLYACKKL